LALARQLDLPRPILPTAKNVQGEQDNEGEQDDEEADAKPVHSGGPMEEIAAIVTPASAGVK
jgi:hypothetical protein